MATLTDTARRTRAAVKIGGALLVTLVVGRVLLTWSLGIYRSLNPPPPPPATVGFGQLPKIVFPKKKVPELSYRLETVDGGVPSFGPNAKVFFISSKQTSLLGLDRGKQKAASLGFVFEPEQIAGTYYRWTNSSPLPATLELDYTLGNFIMEVAWQTDPAFLNSKLVPNELQAISEARGYLKKAGSLPADLANGRAEAKYLKSTGSRLVEALSLSEANFVQVDLYREPIEEASILPADPNKGAARILISGSREQGKRIVLAEFNHTQVEYDLFETYPLIDGAGAWEMLISGQGFVAWLPKTGNEVVVRRVSLGYFDSLDSQQYLQPIYVFEGDDGFWGYVPAIDPAWLL